MITNTDITIYSRKYNPVTQMDEWEREYVSDAWWFKEETISTSKEEIKSTARYVVRIPNINILLKKEDYIVKGKSNIEIETVKDLHDTENLKVISLKYNTFGDSPHIKVVGI